MPRQNPRCRVSQVNVQPVDLARNERGRVHIRVTIASSLDSGCQWLCESVRSHVYEPHCPVGIRSVSRDIEFSADWTRESNGFLERRSLVNENVLPVSGGALIRRAPDGLVFLARCWCI